MKNKFLLFLLFALPAFAFGQVLKTAAVPYTKGASPFTPNTASSSEIRIDTSCSCMYWWDRDNLTWMRVRTGADVISGSAAPSYTPHDNQSLFAVNADSELYYYNGSAWVQIGGSGGGGIYGGSGNVPDGTIASLVDDFEVSGPDISSYTVTTGTSTGGQYFQNFSGATLTHRDTSGSSSLAMSGTGALFSFGDGSTDRLTIGNRDARYSGDYSGTYSARSLIDKGYADATYLSDADLSGAADEVAVFSGANSVTSYPEMAFDGSTLNLNADLNTLKTTPTWSLVDSDASNTGGGGTLVIGNFDGTAIGSGHRLGVMQFMGSTGVSGTAVGGLVESFAYTNFSGTSAASSLVFSTPNIGTQNQTQRLRLSPIGVEARSGNGLSLWNTANTARHTIYNSEDSVLVFEPYAFSEGGEIYLTGEISSSSVALDLNANQNNLFVGTNLFVALSAETTNRNITGIQHRSATGATRYLVLHNDGGGGSHLNNIVLKNQDVASSATNRFALTGGVDFTLEPYESVFLAHIPTSGLDRWVILGSSKTGSGGGSYTDEQAQDAVGTALVDGTTIDFTYDDATPSITAEVKSNVIQAGGNTTAAPVTIGTNDANALSFETNNVVRATITGGASTGGALTVTDVTANTNTAETNYTETVNSTGTAAASFGMRHLYQLESSTTDGQDAAAMNIIWTTATHASRTADVVFSNVFNGGALAESFRVVGASVPVVTIGGGSTTFGNGGITIGAAFSIGGTNTLTLGNNTGLVNIGNNTGAVKFTRNTATAAQTVPFEMIANTTGTPANGLGPQLQFQGESSTTVSQEMGSIAAIWTDVTHATRTAEVIISTVNSAGTGAERFRAKATGVDVTGNLTLNTAGNKINITTGSNASAGQSAAMTAGSITISTTAVTANSLIFLTHASLGGTQGILSVGTITAGTSFVINSSNAADTGTVNWWIIN